MRSNLSKRRRLGGLESTKHQSKANDFSRGDGVRPIRSPHYGHCNLKCTCSRRKCAPVLPQTRAKRGPAREVPTSTSTAAFNERLAETTRRSAPTLRGSRRKRHEADIGAAPTGTLDRRAQSAAWCAASAPPQLVARRISAPTDDGNGAGERRVMLAAFAMQPHPRRRAV